MREKKRILFSGDKHFCKLGLIFHICFNRNFKKRLDSFQIFFFQTGKFLNIKLLLISLCSTILIPQLLTYQ